MARKTDKHVHADEELGQSTTATTTIFHHHQPRRKVMGTAGTRAWLVVSESGQSHLEEVGKHSIMRRTGLPARDLRVLDPVLSYPSTILGRERAIVVNLEHIKAIITAKEILMVNSTNPLVVAFVGNLQKRVSGFNGPPPQQENQNIDTEMVHTVEATLDSTSLDNSSIQAPLATGAKILPFEFRALEACLESACECLESQTEKLEEEAYPALDELTSKISTLNLERVRQIKSRLVEISGRVQKVRDELEHLLDDDNDMAEMYLTEKLDGHSANQTSLSEELCNEELEAGDERDEESISENNSQISADLKTNIEELEMLLEAYFVQIDGVSQKLANMKAVSVALLLLFLLASSTRYSNELYILRMYNLPMHPMNEYVENTEDFINIMLDDKQNQLLQMGVTLSTANMILNAGIVVVGVFGMNISITLFEGQPIQFWETTFGTVGGCLALYLIAVGWGKKRSLL